MPPVISSLSSPLYKSLFEVSFQDYPELTDLVKVLSVSSDQLNIVFNANIKYIVNHLGIQSTIVEPFDILNTNEKYNMTIKMYDKTGIVYRELKIISTLRDFSYTLDYSSSDLVEIDANFDYEHRND